MSVEKVCLAADAIDWARELPPDNDVLEVRPGFSFEAATSALACWVAAGAV
jgi:hypothetical protein